MGSSHSSRHEEVEEVSYVVAVPMRTIQDVRDTLEDSLKQAARDQLWAEFRESVSSYSSLQDCAEAFATASFKNDFPYEWSRYCSPPHNDGTVYRTYDYCFIDDSRNLSYAIAEYVNRELATVPLESWMKRKASADLTAIIADQLNYYLNNTWYHGHYTETYNASNSDVDSYKFDISFVYTNATRSESSLDATLHILYFVGVYYSVKSPTKVAYGELKSSAYAQAQYLSNVSVPTLNSDDTLKQALYQHLTPNFKAIWHYDHFGGKPSDFPSDKRGALYTWNEHVCYLSSWTQSDAFLDAYIEAEIMNGFVIPVPAVKASVKHDIFSAFKNTLLYSSSGYWKSNVYLDKYYELHKSSESPVRMNANILSWRDRKTLIIDDVDGNRKEVIIEIMYLFFLGVVYELTPDPIEQDLTRALYRSISPQSEIPSKITVEQFKLQVEAHNAAKFRETFGFDFPKIATPSNKFWKIFFEINSFNPKGNEVEEKVKNLLFGPDDKKNPEIKHGKQAAIYKFIVESLQYYANSAYPDDANRWFKETKQAKFKYNAGVGDWFLDVRISCAFASGRITEYVRETETINRFYLSLLLDIKAEEGPRGS